MKVKYIHGTEGVSRSNIMFPSSWPMRGGKFPKDHPCYGNSMPVIWGMEGQDKGKDGLALFRQRGYDASCFPEGDGITFAADRDDSHATVTRDIRECFGWEVSK